MKCVWYLYYIYISYNGGYNGGYKPTNITGDVGNPMQ